MRPLSGQIVDRGDEHAWRPEDDDDNMATADYDVNGAIALKLPHTSRRGVRSAIG